MSDYEDQFNPHSSSASGGDLYGLLNDMSSFSQQFEEQEPVVAAVLAQPEAGSSHHHSSVVAVPVEGMENLGLACYTQHTLLDRPKNRARTAVFSFSKIPDEERRFYSRHVASDLLDQQRHPGHGLRVKTTSFFDGPALPDEVTGEQPSDEILTHLVVVSTQPITFPRWHLAFRELKAKSVRVLHYVRTSLGKTQPGFVGVLSIFEGQTTIDELLRNRVIYHGKEHIPSVLVPNPKRSPPSSRKAKRSPSKKRKAASQPATAPAITSASVLSQHISSLSKTSSFHDGLTHASQAFLSDQALSSDAMRDYFEKLHRYLNSLPGTGAMGLFLLSGRPLDIFAQSLGLKAIVLSVLETRYQIKVNQLSTAEVSLHPLFASIDPESRCLLKPIMHLIDQADSDPSTLPSFSIVDPVSCMFLCAVYFLGHNIDGAQHGGPLSEPFLASFASGIAETIRWFANIGFHFNNFLGVHVRDGYLSWGDVGKFMFPFGFTVEQIQRHYTIGLDYLQGVVSNPVPDRYFSRRAQLSKMVFRVRDHFNIPLGDAYFIWKAMFESPQFINVLSPTEEAFRLFPATAFTDNPMLHSSGFGDMKEFARRLVEAQEQYAPASSVAAS